MTGNHEQKHDSVSNAHDTTQRPMSKEVKDWLEMEERIHQQDMEMLRDLLEEKRSSQTAVSEPERQPEHITPAVRLTPEQREQVNKKIQEIEERAEERELAMLERLAQEYKAGSKSTPSTDNHVQGDKKNEETPAKGFIGKVKTWLNASNNALLWAFSKYFPVGCLVCVTPGNAFSFAGNTLEFIATALFYAVIAFVFTETVDHMLGENATNLRRIKAIAAEVVFAAAMFWWLID